MLTRTSLNISQPYQRTVIWSNLTNCGLVLLFLHEFIHHESNIVYLGSYLVAMLMMITGFFRYWEKTGEEKKLLLPLVIIFLIGILHLRAGQYNYYKDIWYFSKPVFYIGAGMLMPYSGLRKNSFLGIIVYISLALSLVHIYTFLLDPQLLTESVNDIREAAGGGNLLVVFAAAYISSRQRFLRIRNFLNIPMWAFLLILYASVLLSFSRTLIGVYLITMLFLERLYNHRYTVRKIGIVVLFVSGLLVITFLFPALFSEDTKVGEIKQKILNSFTEISVHERYDSDSEIAMNWRGYETSLAIEEIKEGTILNKITGYGFGKTIFIGNTDYLGYDMLDIPMLHNGFMEIIIKTGFAGLLLYLIFFWKAIRIAVRNNEGTPDEANFLMGILVSCFLATLGITGYYNKSALDSTCVITGFLLSWIIRNKRKTNISPIKCSTNLGSGYAPRDKRGTGKKAP